MDERQRGWLRLGLTPGLGRVRLTRLLERFGSIEAILAAGSDELMVRGGLPAAVAAAIPAADAPELDALAARLEREQVRLLSLADDDYPPSLRQIHDPPLLLYLRGRLPEQPCLAVVGGRQASAAGCRWTEALCRELAGAGIGIVSGLARGIDTAAHAGALAGEGYTLAVLGCGIDRIYPPENASLYHALTEGGGILSEYPPGTLPKPGHFPARNRLISGLAAGVLVVEAAADSGSLITAEFALEQGREVFAAPGAVYLESHAGVNRLLKEGATPVTEAADLLAFFGCAAGSRPAARSFAPPEAPAARRVWETLGQSPLHPEEIASQCRLTPGEVSDILLDLELAGGVQQLPGLRYLRRFGP